MAAAFPPAGALAVVAFGLAAAPLAAGAAFLSPLPPAAGLADADFAAAGLAAEGAAGLAAAAALGAGAGVFDEAGALAEEDEVFEEDAEAPAAAAGADAGFFSSLGFPPATKARVLV